MAEAFLLLAVIALASGAPAKFGPPPLSAPGGFVSAQRPPSGIPPALSAPGGFVSAQRPTSGIPPALSAPGGFVSSQRPQRPSSGLPPPLSAPGGIGGQQPPPPAIVLLIDEREGPLENGSYNFNFETGNGISRYESGAPQGQEGAVASQGGWSFTFPDGTPAEFTFVADENGYRPVSNLLPTPHPLPAHAIAQIEFARQQETNQAGDIDRRYSS